MVQQCGTECTSRLWITRRWGQKGKVSYGRGYSLFSQVLMWQDMVSLSAWREGLGRCYNEILQKMWKLGKRRIMTFRCFLFWRSLSIILLQILLCDNLDFWYKQIKHVEGLGPARNMSSSERNNQSIHKSPKDTPMLSSPRHNDLDLGWKYPDLL